MNTGILEQKTTANLRKAISMKKLLVGLLSLVRPVCGQTPIALGNPGHAVTDIHFLISKATSDARGFYLVCRAD
jgi:hypothetical protein